MRWSRQMKMADGKMVSDEMEKVKMAKMQMLL